MIPDLDYYFSELAGYRSHGRKITKWSDKKIDSVRRSVARTFLDRHPRYCELLSRVASDDFPRLSDALQVAERTRIVLDEVLAELQRNRATVA